MIKLLGGWQQISGVTLNPLWGSLACGKNYYLNSHVDEDFFYSLTTVASEQGVQDNDRYMMEAAICNYFTFAEQGIAVALRPGDMLIFNPLYHHCLFSRTARYENDDSWKLSFHTKIKHINAFCHVQLFLSTFRVDEIKFLFNFSVAV